LFRQYSWPGNLRELQGVLKQALVQATGPVLIPAFLPERFRNPEPVPGEAPPIEGLFSEAFLSQQLQAGSQNLYAEALGLMERQSSRRGLDPTRGNQLQAATSLGSTRGSLRFKMRTLDISVEKTVNKDDEPGE